MSSREVPSLAALRPGMSPNMLSWVNSVLSGMTSAEWAEYHGIRTRSAALYSRMFAEMAGLEIADRAGSIRESVLRMRIAELEGR